MSAEDGGSGIDWEAVMSEPERPRKTETREGAVMVFVRGTVDDAGYGGGIFPCPVCRESFSYTHLDVVEVHDAAGHAVRLTASGEDAGSKIIIETVPNQEDGRRHTVVLELSCELCGATVRLAFQQHKGQTITSLRAERPVE